METTEDWIRNPQSATSKVAIIYHRAGYRILQRLWHSKKFLQGYLGHLDGKMKTPMGVEKFQSLIRQISCSYIADLVVYQLSYCKLIHFFNASLANLSAAIIV